MRVRTHNAKHFSISNEAVRSPDLSWAAVGLLAYCLSMSENWEFKPKAIWKTGKGSRDEVYALFKELIEVGHCIRIQEFKGGSRGRGRLLGAIHYEIFDSIEECKERALELLEQEIDIECRAEFKNCYRRPDFRDTDNRDTDHRDPDSQYTKKKEDTEEKKKEEKKKEKQQQHARDRRQSGLSAQVQPAAPSEEPRPTASASPADAGDASATPRFAAAFSSYEEASKGPRSAGKHSTAQSRTAMQEETVRNRTALGSDPIQNTSLKSPAAKHSPPNVEAHPPLKPKAYECLSDLEIPENEKLKITKAYPEEEVKYAVKWATHPKTKLKGTMQAAIKWACANPPDMPQEDSVERNREYAYRYDGHENAGNYVQAFRNHVEVNHRSGSIRDNAVRYDESCFMDKFHKLLRRCRIMEDS